MPLEITPEAACWTYCGLRVVEGACALDTGEEELIVLPLDGGCEASVDGESYALEGRDDVFTGINASLYVPRDAQLELSGAGRVALPSSRCERRLEPLRVAAAEVSVELRGGGPASRQINHVCGPEAGFADRLIAVEVLTPEGNWSSYPPHKHDEDVPGVETALEEIYYFEVSDGGFAYQRAYGPQIDILREVRTGDTVLLPSGYHGPSMAAPGYHLYYLNVMAGPSGRAWLFTDDPAHAWVRDTWEGEEIDDRLPMTSAG